MISMQELFDDGSLAITLSLSLLVSAPKTLLISSMAGWSQPQSNCRRLQVSVSAFVEKIKSNPEMHHLEIPHFILHDFDDEEESKIIRMMLTYANIPFETKVVQRDDFILEDYPFYALPMLEVNGRKLGSVPSICRQLGWRYEMSGMTANEDSDVDMVAEKIFEVRMRIKNFLDHIEYREDHECDETCSSAVATSYVDTLCTVLEQLLRNSHSSWLVGHKMTWADLIAACLFNPITYHQPHLFDRYPRVYLHTKRVSELEQFTGFLYHVKDRTI